MRTIQQFSTVFNGFQHVSPLFNTIQHLTRYHLETNSTLFNAFQHLSTLFNAFQRSETQFSDCGEFQGVLQVYLLYLIFSQHSLLLCYFSQRVTLCVTSILKLSKPGNCGKFQGYTRVTGLQNGGKAQRLFLGTLVNLSNFLGIPRVTRFTQLFRVTRYLVSCF